MLNANHTQRWHSMPTLNADTQCWHSKIYHTFMSAMDSTLAWLLDFFWNSSISSLMLEPISPKFMYMFCNTAQVHVHVLKHKFTYMFWNTAYKFMYMFCNTAQVHVHVLKHRLGSWTCSETQHTSSCTCSETQCISCIIATTRVSYLLDFNVPSTAQDHLRTNKICHKQTYFKTPLIYIRKPFLFANQIRKINPYINKHKLQTQIFKELALQ